MINGLDRINYDQLTGLVAVKATSIETDEISYDEIYTLHGIQSNIQTQLNNLQNVISEIGNITISGTTLSGIVFKSYLETYYYDIPSVQGKVTESQNQILETLTTNYYNKSQSDAINTTISDRINSISGALNITNNNLVTISSKVQYITSTTQSGGVLKNTNCIYNTC